MVKTTALGLRRIERKLAFAIAIIALNCEYFIVVS